MNAITIIILLGPIVLIVFFVLFLIRLIQMVLFNLRQNTLYRQRIKNYQEEKQLSNVDLEIFHEAMEELRQQILRYEAATKKNKRLRAIEKEHGGLKSSKEIFQELMAHPDELTKFSDFLYHAIPSAADASEKVDAITEVDLPTPEIEKSLENILTTMTVISSSITSDYEAIIREDSEEIELTKKILEKNRG
ncbi:5-bromo-4-chloroindolyl phosphate hydrolysis family protein [Enterococcus malodoratus]|uniref:5-bromo-4-chloroindolyl phosphate hydrolysis protein n=1 Tax=Enterococcus malodoratus ATCC 43197 TaxID=1158601 RepID=R2QMF7_9ENTE|nr:5-bromo-4-chloroindolyl phosphate hydrolysis family protein [Enterococcus malodoratus]EOH72810.1 hypothetical protein UAI_03694 [Enterococcus malodoratus ATCC 43197]EOT67358.1 hypothetical protein I585_02879 [Enterococcus malodoratus ATCC 43197]SPX03185.1 5-bromo-4-chloroindolyl phosphate hydrolase family protein [Enterococcus malodoratus]STD69390.1 5-bromo-4-chloroindolyl phosphate hydrolase family protein [Enterococcus malodoratus]